MILQAALLVASLACYTVATAVVPLPSTGRAQLSPSKLRHRQTSKMDIVRRASKLRKRQNGPSAVPAPAILCGSTPAFEPFYLSTVDPGNLAGLLYITSSIPDINESGAATFAFTDDPSLAISYLFDNQCRLSASDSAQQAVAWVNPGSTYINPNLGTEEFLGPRGLDVLTCVGQEGELRCGTDDYLPIETARFCQSTSGTLQLSTVPTYAYSCAPLSLAISNAPPPQPVGLMCGDRPVGQQFYISSPRPDTPQFASLYGRVEEGQISYEGASPLYSGAEESSAIPFMFDASCALVRVTQVRDVTRLVAPIGATATTPRFGTAAYIDSNPVDVLTCTSTDGFLQCGTSQGNLPVDTSNFCLTASPNGSLFSLSSEQDGACLPIALELTDSPPPAWPIVE